MLRKNSLLGVSLLLPIYFLASFGCVAPEDEFQIDARGAFIDARSTLLQAADSDDAFTRSHAIEALTTTMGSKSGGIFTEALNDTSPAVRFAAAMAIGDVKHAPARQRLLSMAVPEKGEPDKRVWCAVIYALYQLDDETYTGELGRLLLDREQEVRANAAMVMGKMGEPSAVGPLKMVLEDEQVAAVRLQITESLAQLGDEKSRLLLEAYTKTQFIEDRLIAIPAMVKVRSPRAKSIYHELISSSRQPPRVKVAAAGALAQLGEVDETGYLLCLDSLRYPETVMQKYFGPSRKIKPIEITSLRRLAAMSLGDVGKREPVDSLQAFLNAEDGGVRVASAMAIIKILSDEQDDLPGENPAQSQPQLQKPAEAAKFKLHTSGAKD